MVTTKANSSNNLIKCFVKTVKTLTWNKQDTAHESEINQCQARYCICII